MTAATFARLSAPIARIDLARLGESALRGLLLTTLAVSAVVFTAHSF
jgi:hypothetical protein